MAAAVPMGVRGQAGTQVGLFRVMSPDLRLMYFPGGFHRQEDAEVWALGAWIRGAIGDYKVIRL